MKPKIAFIDCENVDINKHLLTNINQYNEIILFKGAKQHIKACPLPHYTGRVSTVYVGACAKNNLDFHLTMELGRLHETQSLEVEFVIVSGDTGFDGVLAYLSEMGRDTTRVNPTCPKSIKKGCSLAVLKRCKENKVLAKTLPKLINQLGSQLNIYDNEDLITQELVYLREKNYIRVTDDQRIEYSIT
jgi:hypothetical protein